MIDEPTTFTLTIEMNGAAFSDEEYEHELSRLLNLVAANLEEGHDGGGIFDINGNAVGWYKIEG